MTTDFQSAYDADDRTCLACDAPVAQRVRGFMGSLRGCDLHLDMWRTAPEREAATLEQMTTGKPAVWPAYEAWALRQRQGNESSR